MVMIHPLVDTIFSDIIVDGKVLDSELRVSIFWVNFITTEPCSPEPVGNHGNRLWEIIPSHGPRIQGSELL
jgi:hypothetical protein